MSAGAAALGISVLGTFANGAALVGIDSNNIDDSRRRARPAPRMEACRRITPSWRTSCARRNSRCRPVSASLGEQRNIIAFTAVGVGLAKIKDSIFSRFIKFGFSKISIGLDHFKFMVLKLKVGLFVNDHYVFHFFP